MQDRVHGSSMWNDKPRVPVSTSFWRVLWIDHEFTAFLVSISNGYVTFHFIAKTNFHIVMSLILVKCLSAEIRTLKYELVQDKVEHDYF